MTVRNEIKGQIVRVGYTMHELVDRPHEEDGWKGSGKPGLLSLSMQPVLRWGGKMPPHTVVVCLRKPRPISSRTQSPCPYPADGAPAGRI